MNRQSLFHLHPVYPDLAIEPGPGCSATACSTGHVERTGVQSCANLAHDIDAAAVAVRGRADAARTGDGPGILHGAAGIDLHPVAEGRPVIPPGTVTAYGRLRSRDLPMF